MMAITLGKAPERRAWVSYWPIALAVIVSSLVLWLAHMRLQERQVDDLNAAFQRRAHLLHERLSERIRTFDEILKGGAGLFAASGDVSRTEWRTYVSALQLDEDYFGIQGLGFVPLVPGSGLAAHEAAVRREGFLSYEVRPRGARDVYAPVTLLEPFHGRNKLAFGFDMYSEPVRREAMHAARDRGAITYSGRVKLVQETEVDVQSGVLAYMPVYKSDEPPATVDQRRERIVGWVQGTFRMADMLRATFRDDIERVNVQLTDVSRDQASKSVVLFESLRNAEGAPAQQAQSLITSVVLPLKVHGRDWLLSYEAVPGAWPLDGHQDYWVEMAVVSLGCFMFCALAWSVVTTRSRALAIARQLTAEVAAGEERFRLMVEGVKDYAVLMLDPEGYVQSWNEGAKRIKGWDADEIIGQHFSKFYTPAEVANQVPEHALAMALVTGQHKGEGPRVRKDGSLFRAAALITTLRDESGQVRGFTKVTRDISDQYEQQERLRLSDTVFRSTQEGVAITDARGKVLAVNPAFERITEYHEAEVLGENLRLLSSGRHDRAFVHSFWEVLLDTGFWQGEIWNRRKSGEEHRVWLAVSAVLDADRVITNFVGVYTDITRIPQAQAHIDRLAHHDALTGLPNRVLLASRLEHTIERSRRTSKLCAVMYMDLDRFKPVNDQMGHEAGDELLKGVAQRLRSNLRDNDTVARIGGDEFVIVLEELSSPDGAEVVAQAVIRRMSEPFDLGGGREVTIGCSIGIAMFPAHGADSEALLRLADTALYASKNGGRGRASFYTES